MNTQILFPYGKTHVTASIPREELAAVLEAPLSSCPSPLSQEELVKQALEHPTGSPSLEELAAGAGRILIITSDHTRQCQAPLLCPLF